MADEIEKKFLMQSDRWRDLPILRKMDIRQAYFNGSDTQLFLSFSENGAVQFSFAKDGKRFNVQSKDTKDATADFQDIVDRPEFNKATGGLNLAASGATGRIRFREDLTSGLLESFFTVKFSTNDPERNDEFEIGLNPEDALLVYKAMGIYEVEKTRNMIDYHGSLWEVDEFKGRLQGLVLAEIEVPSMAHFDTISKLPGLGADVTAIRGYSNRALGQYGIPRSYAHLKSHRP